MRAARTILFDDRTIHWNALGRVYRFYEYTGLMKSVYGDTLRLGENVQDFRGTEFYATFVRYPQYNLTEYVPSAPSLLVTIEEGPYRLTTLRTLQLLASRIVGTRAWQERANDILTLTTTPLP